MFQASHNLLFRLPPVDQVEPVRSPMIFPQFVRPLSNKLLNRRFSCGFALLANTSLPLNLRWWGTGCSVRSQRRFGFPDHLLVKPASNFGRRSPDVVSRKRDTNHGRHLLVSDRRWTPLQNGALILINGLGELAGTVALIADDRRAGSSAERQPRPCLRSTTPTVDSGRRHRPPHHRRSMTPRGSPTPGCWPMSARKARSPSPAARSIGSPGAVRRSSVSRPTTARPTGATPSATCWSGTALSTSAPDPKRRAPTARSNASSRPACANGPTHSRSRRPPIVPRPCCLGSPTTILHHNTHLSMPLKGIEFPDRDAIPRQI